jgi:DNA replication regulator SLD3
VYALCKLWKWVTIEHLDERARISKPAMSLASPDIRNNGSSNEWWNKAAIGKDLKDLDSPAKRPKLSMAPLSPIASGLHSASPNPVPPIALILADNPKDSSEVQVHSQQVFETLVQHYLEALYKSKTSLAFFAKGPLSRARAACAASTQGDLSFSHLAAFLRCMLLNMSAMDKKYREKLQAMIETLPPMSWSDYEQEGPASTKKRKSKKLPKLSREGTYPFELDYVKRWWYGDPSRHREETQKEMMKRKIGSLRVRETLAQVILVLEILSLETTPEFKTREASANTGCQETLDEPEVEKKKKRKAKKPTNLLLLLDLLMDKLSIWQSIENDGSAVTTDRTNDLSMRDNDDKLQERDLLAGFCTEVVIPLSVFLRVVSSMFKLTTKQL